jgi:hypothetical protein
MIKTSKKSLVLILCLIALMFIVSVHAYAEDSGINRNVSLNYDGASVIVDFFTIRLTEGSNEIMVSGLPETIDLASVEVITQNSGVRVMGKYLESSDEIILHCFIESDSRKDATFRLTYSMTGIEWSINYTAIISETGNNVDFVGSLVIHNGTSADLTSSKVSIMSKDPDFPSAVVNHPIAALLGMKSYQISQEVDLGPYTSAVIELCRMTALSSKVQYYVNHYVDPVFDSEIGTKVTLPVHMSLALIVTNATDVLLDSNLPGGNLKVYATGRLGEIYLISEGTMKNVTTNLRNLSIDLGVVPDLYLDILCTDKRKIGTSSWEEAYQLIFTNKLGIDVEVELVKYFRNNWSILQNTAGSWTKTDDGNAKLVVNVKKNTTQDVLFRIRYTE